jgi:hypothetical protein
MTSLVLLAFLLQETVDLRAEAAAQNDTLDQCIEAEAREAGDDLQGDALAAHVTETCEEERLALRATAVALMTAAGMSQEAAETSFDTNYPEHLAEVLIEITADSEGR